MNSPRFAFSLNALAVVASVADAARNSSCSPAAKPTRTYAAELD